MKDTYVICIIMYIIHLSYIYIYIYIYIYTVNVDNVSHAKDGLLQRKGLPRWCIKSSQEKWI